MSPVPPVKFLYKNIPQTVRRPPAARLSQETSAGPTAAPELQEVEVQSGPERPGAALQPPVHTRGQGRGWG